MTPEHDPLERRLARALATTPDPRAADRLRARVSASLVVSASEPTPRPGRRGPWLAPLAASAAALFIVVMLAIVWSRPSGPASVVNDIPASWARGYADIADLAADADLVVEGTVRTLATGLGGSPPTTRVGLEVARVLQGEATGTIEVLQTGGSTPEGAWVVLGDPPMEVGEHALMFLRRIGGAASTDSYVVLGGPQGRFDVAGEGTITPIGDTPVVVPSGTTVDDVSAELATLHEAATAACRGIMRSVPLAHVRSGTPTVVGADALTGARLERYLGSLAGPSSSPAGMADAVTMCLIDGDFEMRTPGPPGHDDRARRILVIVIEGKPQLWRWTRTPEALPTLPGHG